MRFFGGGLLVGAIHAEKQGQVAPNSLRIQVVAGMGSIVCIVRPDPFYSSMDDGMPVDYVEAMHWFHQSAEKSLMGMQFILGVLFDQGTVTPPTYYVIIINYVIL